LISCLGMVVPTMVTYIVRHSAWSVMLTMAMGLEGYPYRVALIDQQLSYASKNFAKYENIPKGAEERALARRSTWVVRHLGTTSEMFSMLVVTSADITSLLRDIEEDQSIVHAAYYTDDECIARIADWIAGRG